jgi:hypothetical protein
VRAQRCRPAKCAWVGSVANFLPSIIITWVPVVVELRKETPHTHSRLRFNPPDAGSKAGIPGGCCGCRQYSVHARKGIEGVDGAGGWAAAKTRHGCNMHRLRSADLRIDRQDGNKDDDDDDSNVAQRMLLHCLDVIWCKWRFTCDIEDLINPAEEGVAQASKHASPTLATLLGPRYVHESKMEASGWQRHRTVAPRLQFSRHK